MNKIIQKSITVHRRKCIRSRTFRSIFISLKQKKRNLNKNSGQKLIYKLSTGSVYEFRIQFLNIFTNIFFLLLFSLKNSIKFDFLISSGDFRHNTTIWQYFGCLRLFVFNFRALKTKVVLVLRVSTTYGGALEGLYLRRQNLVNKVSR